MAKYCEIREFRDGLRIRVGEAPGRRERILGAFFGAAFGAIVAGAVAMMGMLRPWWPVISLIGGAAGFVSRRSEGVELSVTKSEFTWTGHAGKGGPKTIVLFTADIRGLEFRSGCKPTADGLYAITSRWPHLLLPDLNGQEADRVLKAIRERFPGLAEDWAVQVEASETSFTGGLGK